jgi:uncharacterized protein
MPALLRCALVGRLAAAPMTAALAALAALVALAAPAPAQRLDVPANDGWVTDLADLVPPAEEAELEAYLAGKTDEVAVLTVPELGGDSIERFALEVARAWQIGSPEAGRGALLVVASADREFRIEVSRAAEGQLTDATCGRILRGEIAPRFQDGDFAGGLRAGVEAIHGVLAGEPYDGGNELAKELGKPLLQLVFVIAALAVIALMNSRRSRRRHGMLGMPHPMLWTAARGAGGWGGGGGSRGGFGGGFRGFGGGGSFGGGGASGRW